MMYDRIDRLILMLVLVAGLLLTLGELSHPVLNRSSECRPAVVAREMLATDDYVVPRLNGHLRLEKPPLYYWAVLPVAGLLDAIDTFANRLPAYTFTLVFMLLTALFAMQRACWRQQPGNVQWAAALFAMLGVMALPGLWFRANAGEAESLLALTTGLVLYFLYRDLRQPAARWRLWAYVFSGLAFMVKGPVFLLFSWPVYLLLARRRLRRDGYSHLWGLLVFVLIAMPWYLWVVLRLDEGWSVFSSEVAMRFSNYAPHTEPVYFYADMLLSRSGPLLPALLAGGMLAWRHRREDVAERFLLMAGLLGLVLLSLLQSKQLHYLLPLMPLMGLYISDAAIHPWNPGPRVQQLLTGLLWVLMLVVGVLLLVSLMMGSYLHVAGLLGVMIIMGWTFRRRQHSGLVPAAMMLAVLTVLAGYASYWHYANPVQDFKHDFRGFMTGLDRAGIRDDVVTTWDNACLFYCRGRHLPQYFPDEWPLKLDEIRENNSRRYLLTKGKDGPLPAMAVMSMERGNLWLWDMQRGFDDFPETRLSLRGREQQAAAIPALSLPESHTLACGRADLQTSGGVSLMRLHLRADCSGDSYLETLHQAHPLFAEYIGRWKILWLSSEEPLVSNLLAEKLMQIYSGYFVDTQGIFVVLDETGLLQDRKLPNDGQVFTPGPAGIQLEVLNEWLWVSSGGDTGTVWRQQIEDDEIVLEPQPDAIREAFLKETENN